MIPQKILAHAAGTAPSNSTKPKASRQVGVQIHKARRSDAAAIADIAHAVNIVRYAPFQKGFLVYSLTPHEYARRISDGQHVFVFRRGGRIIGFVCGYTNEQFARYLSNGSLSHESTIGATVTRLAAEAGHHFYAFLDQIGIVPDHQDRGFGEAAFGAFCDRVPGPFYVAMLEAPTRNPRIDFWQARGFRRVGEAEEILTERFAFTSDELAAPPRLTWGIYLLPDGGYEAKSSRR